METLRNAIVQTLQSQELRSNMTRKQSLALRNLRQPSTSVIESGVNALDLIPSEEVKTETLTKAIAILQANFGTEFSSEKISVLFDMIREECWSEERFQRTLKWFLKNKKFPSWTVSDWFDYGVKLYPRAWYLKQCHENGGYAPIGIQFYKLPDEKIAYKYKDDEELPFEELFF